MDDDELDEDELELLVWLDEALLVDDDEDDEAFDMADGGAGAAPAATTSAYSRR